MKSRSLCRGECVIRGVCEEWDCVKRGVWKEGGV